MIRKPLLFIFSLFTILSCSTSSSGDEEYQLQTEYLNSFPSILPDYLLDQGAWFGLAFLEKELGLQTLVLSDSFGYNLEEPILRLQCFNNGKLFQNEIEQQFLPGKLVQKSQNKKQSIQLETIFANSQMALIAYTISNTNNQAIEVEMRWQLPQKFDFDEKSTFSCSLPKSQMEIQFEEFIQQSNGKFSSKYVIPGFASIRKYIVLKHSLSPEDRPTKINFKEANTIFRNHTQRWFAYLQPYQGLSLEKQLLAAKCIQTLLNNWRSPYGEFKYSGVYPSYYQNYFNGNWAWDSWKHAVALASFTPEVAKDQIRLMFSFQNENGMIPDVVYCDTTLDQHNWRNTKPPLASWAVYQVFKQTNDTAFVKEMLPKLIKYHTWWYTFRDFDKNNICEFGSTDGTQIAASWESGMDNAVRFDSTRMLKDPYSSHWSMNQENIDLNAYLYAEKKYLIEFSKLFVSSQPNESQEFLQVLEREMPPIKNRLANYFHDEESNYFYDYNFDKKQHVKVRGPEAWATLWAEIADTNQALGVVQSILDTNLFNTFCPFPTLDASHPGFNPENGYWRGPVWLDQAYFALEGMRKYGFIAEANRMQEKLLQNAEGLMEAGKAIRENYDPRNGKGLNAKHFSWSAAHLLLLLQEEVKLLESSDSSQLK